MRNGDRQMTNIEIKDQDGRCELKVEGHSGYSSAGTDIVCSAISILCFTLLNEVMEKQDKALKIQHQQKDGYFFISFSNKYDRCLKAVFYAVCNGLQMVAEQYPKHVLLRFLTNRGEILHKDMQQ